MKPDIHPEYREVVFQDTSSDFAFVTRSTIDTSDTIEWEDGKTYPLAKVEMTSASHPFYTGKQILVDSGGRVERFRRRYAKVGVDTGTAATPAASGPPAGSEPAAASESAGEPPVAADDPAPAES